MKKLRKITTIISIILFAFLLCSCEKSGLKSVTPTTMKVDVLDIGKADAIIINTGTHTVLIDAGESDDGPKILKFLIQNNIGYIDYMIITHFDKDHIGGASYLVNSIGIGQVIQPNYDETGNEYIDYCSAVLNKNIPITNLNEKIDITLDLAQFTIYPPKQDYYDDVNDYSLVTSVTHESMSFLFAGDADTVRLNELIKQGNLKHTFLKVPHHGDYNKISKDFINAVSPEYAIITCSDENKESKKIMQIFKDTGTKVYLTRDGNVECISDGKSITITQ